MRILFFKATVKGDHSTAPLFATPVNVKGYVTADGTYVAPHHSQRHKKLVIVRTPPHHGEPDLFSAPHTTKKPEQPSLFDAPPKPEQPKAVPPPEPATPEPTPRAQPLMADLPDDAEMIQRGQKWIVRHGEDETDPQDSQEAAADAAREKFKQSGPAKAELSRSDLRKLAVAARSGDEDALVKLTDLAVAEGKDLEPWFREKFGIPFKPIAADAPKTVKQLYNEACHGAGAEARTAARDEIAKRAKATGKTVAELLQAENLDLSAYSASAPIKQATKEEPKPEPEPENDADFRRKKALAWLRAKAVRQPDETMTVSPAEAETAGIAAGDYKITRHQFNGTIPYRMARDVSGAKLTSTDLEHESLRLGTGYRGGEGVCEYSRTVYEKVGAATAPQPDAEPEKAPAAPTAPARPEPKVWSVEQGTSKTVRRNANERALAILEAKSDNEMTDADRDALARYTGRGGIGTSLNEFYTPPEVAEAIWQALGTLGFRGGTALEPSCGTGVFLHTAPAGTTVTGVEMDGISSRIAGILHRGAGHEVQASSLERFATQDGRQFDAVIGNPPFGLRGETISDDKRDLSRAEAYFVDTALDKTKDGGLVAMIVPTGLVDSSGGIATRRRLLAKGEFLGAVRLPNTAFEAAHTEVTSDVVFFRKRPQEVANALGAAYPEELEALGVDDPEFIRGHYFTQGRGAKNVFGQLEPGWRAKAGMGNDITVTGTMRGVPEALAAWQPDAHPDAKAPNMTEVLAAAEAHGGPAEHRRIMNSALRNPYQTLRLGDVRVIDGVRYVLQGEPPRWHKAGGDVPPAVEDAMAIGDMLGHLLKGNGEQRELRAATADALDGWIKQHGLPAKNKDLMAWLRAPALPVNEEGDEDHLSRVREAQHSVSRLLGAVSENGSYSDTVTGRHLAVEGVTVDTAATKLAAEAGDFTVEELAAASGKSVDEIRDHLFAVADYAVDSAGTHWTTMDAYLSGDMWPKLDAAKAALTHAGMAPEFQAKYRTQADALEQAIAPQSLEDVEVTFNAGFITPELLTAWSKAKAAKAELEHPDRYKHAPDGNKFAVFKYDPATAMYSASGARWGDVDIMLRTLNRDGVKKKEIEDVARINDEFKEWLLSSPFREAVEDEYNRKYRGYRAIEYSDAPIDIPGLNPNISINGYHWSGLRWAMAQGKGIIADDVGLGKTARGLMLARLAKASGQAKKPTIVVPKSVLANWLQSAEFWFPGSRVLTIGESYSKDKDGNVISKADDAATRKRKLHQMQQNDYDFVFISQPAWNDIDVDPITKGRMADDDFWTKRGDSLGNAGDKKLNAIRTAYKQAMAQRDFATREDTIYFGDLGVDMLIMDEGHAFKNLFAAKSRFGESPKFLGGSGESNRALDTLYKTAQLRAATGGKGVYMLTATPTKNSPLEIYSMLSHIAPEQFEQMGIKNSEDFLDRFVEMGLDEVLGTDGEIKEALVTKGFKNLDELRGIMRRYMNRRTAADVGLKIPGAKHVQHLIDMTDDQEAVYSELRAQAKQASSGDGEADAHIFSVMSNMGKASIDLDLLGYENSVSPKIDACVAQALEGVKDGGQIIFCDHVAVHTKVADALVRAGVDRARIAIINGETTKSGAARQKASDDFNNGKVDFVIGNTPTMGEGMNLQARTTDMHDLDMAWNPDTMHQRWGRGVRQGNKNESVRVHGYLAKGSFDGYRFQTIAAKKDWQDELWNGGDRVDNRARDGAVSRADMLIMLSADPDAERAKRDANLKEAKARRDVEESGKALETFSSMQKMQASLERLKKTLGRDIQYSTAAQRLEAKIEKHRAALTENRWFPHKGALASKTPVLIEPTTGHAWTEGKAFVMQPGTYAPVNYSSGDTTWVVTGVDLTKNEVKIRLYGHDDSYDIPLDRMKSGVTPIQYSAEAERKQIASDAMKKIDSGATMGLHTLRSLPLADMDTEALQAGMKRKLANHQAGYQVHVGMVDRETGEPAVIPFHSFRSYDKSHDLILPTKEGTEAAIEAHNAAAMSRDYELSNFNGANGQPDPVYASADPSMYRLGDNPWNEILREVHGPEALARANAGLRRKVYAAIQDAPTFADAMRGALPAVQLARHVTYRGDAWPSDVVKALYNKANREGALNKPIDHVVRDSGVHPAFLTPPAHNLGTVPNKQMTRDMSVREWLRRLLPKDEVSTLPKDAGE